MTVAIVGTIGAVSGPTYGAITPAWGAGESRTANNLLLCGCMFSGTNTPPTTPTGWNAAEPTYGNYLGVVLYWRVATGGDAAPTVGQGGIYSIAQLGEWSGQSTWGVDENSYDTESSGAYSALAVAAYPDAAAGELLVALGFAYYFNAATKTTSHAFNNGAGAPPNSTKNDSTSTNFHYNFGWGVTTGNTVSDQDTFSFTTLATNCFATLIIVSFTAPAGLSSGTGVSLAATSTEAISASLSTSTGAALAPTATESVAGGLGAGIGVSYGDPSMVYIAASAALAGTP